MTARMRITTWLPVAVAMLHFLPVLASGQVAVPGISPAPNQEDRGGFRTPNTPKAAAPEDLTGYWVSLVTEDWIYRMITPAKGDYESVPLNAEGKRVADNWDPSKDEADGNSC